MEKTICSFKGVFGGIYEWGVGYINSEVYRKWKEFWSTQAKGIFWHYADFGDTSYLVSVCGSIYLHPMDFNGMLIGCGCWVMKMDGRKVYFESELSELNELCKACAEYCGGEFNLYVTDEKSVEVGELAEYKEED